MSDNPLTPELALGILQEDLRNLHVVGIKVAILEAENDAGERAVFIMLKGVRLQESPEGYTLELEGTHGTATDDLDTA